MAAATAWEQYPANWSRCDTISLNATDLLRLLRDPDGIFFSEDADEINVRITDVNSGI
jgi:non-ribosomal peptide synthetase component F